MKPRMEIGGRYNWRNQPERLVYLGKNWSGNGYWHQFALTSKPTEVWCEVVDADLEFFEETQAVPAQRREPKGFVSPRQERKRRKAAKRAATQKGTNG